MFTKKEVQLPRKEESMKKRAFVFLISVFIIASGLKAGGWNNTLMGARAMAIGGAFVGLADDPTAIFFNPAGVAYQENQFNFSIDGFYIWPTHDYTSPAGSTAQSKFNTALPQIFFTYRMNEKVTLGFGAFVPYAGGGVDWRKEDLGLPLKSYLAVISLSPSVAYQLNRTLSVGFNLNFYRGLLDVETEMEGFGPLNAEESGSAISASLGLMYKPTEKLGIGFTVRAPAKMTLSGKTSIFQTVPGFGTLKLNLESETSFNLPWDIEAGFSYRLTESFVFSAGAQYTMWSRLKQVDKTIKDIPTIGDINEAEVLNFNDILILHAGFEYLIPGGIALRGGIGYDRSASPTDTLSVMNIDVDKLSLLGGIGYKTGKTQIDFVYIYVRGNEREKTSMVYPGMPLFEKYNLNVDILGLGVTFSF